jgi:hypothetical protein
MEQDVALPVAGELVSFTLTFTSPNWRRPEVSHSTLRFLDAPRLSAFLAEAGLDIEDQYGDWDRAALTARSPEIITIARPRGRAIRRAAIPHCLIESLAWRRVGMLNMWPAHRD